MFRKQAAHEPEEKEGLAHNLYYWLQTLVVAVVAIVLLFGANFIAKKLDEDTLI